MSDKDAFFALLRAGLWEKEARLPLFDGIDFNEVYRLAEEQSVVGLVAAGMEHVTDVKIPQTTFLFFVGNAIQIEQRNKAMNAFVAELIERLRKADIYAILVKGQGIAQCYERPLWRACGDVDLLLSDENYYKAYSLLTPLASKVYEENPYNKHLAMTIESWPVELHGTLRGFLKKRIDGVIDQVQDDVFYGGSVRSWMNGNTQIFLPKADNDVVFIFSHILQHFFKDGIGLRQICDWCRLLWICRNALNYSLLESRIHKAGLMTEWKSFAALVVDYLGMPVEAIPMYSPSKHWSRQARRIMSCIISSGNNRDNSYYTKYPYLTRKVISFCKRTTEGIKHFSIFPVDSFVVWLNMIVNGLRMTMMGK